MNKYEATEKSTVEEIRVRFDNDVERFSHLETGQSATIDAPVTLELITTAAATTNPHATHVLDIGCGAGNYTLKLLQKLPNLNCVLNDLSQPMLDRAHQRVSAATNGIVTTVQQDIRNMDLGSEAVDVVLASMVLHHLRSEAEWVSVFQKVYQSLRPGGSFWISDLVVHSNEAIEAIMWSRYGQYLSELQDEAYRDRVFAYVTKEDSPRPLMYQLDLLRKVGFQQVELLHKNSCFAAFGGIKQ